MPERGSSLIEVLVASTIVITALVGLAQLFAVSIAASQRANTRTQATVLAQEKIEELIASRTDPDSGSDYIDASGRTVNSDTAAPAGFVFIRRWQSEALAVDPDAYVVRVWVTLPLESGGIDLARLIALKAPRLAR